MEVQFLSLPISNDVEDALGWNRVKSMVCEYWDFPSNLAASLSFKYLLHTLLTLWTLANNNLL